MKPSADHNQVARRKTTEAERTAGPPEKHRSPGRTGRAGRVVPLIVGLSLLLARAGIGQVLPLPPRPAVALSGTQITNLIASLPRSEREEWIEALTLAGHVPDFERALVPVTTGAVIGGSNYTATIHVLPDYLALGTDADYFLAPMTPILAQRLADRLDCSLPTRRMANLIWTNATAKLTPQPIPPSSQMTTVPVFAQHNAMVRAQRDTFTNAAPPGALVAGDKKDIVISPRIYTNFAVPANPKPVAIYGWHFPNGSPIQPLYNGHGETYADYSHGVRLAQSAMTVNGSTTTVSAVLSDPRLHPLLSDEGAIPVPRYTLSPQPPKVVLGPRDQVVVPGQSVTLDALVIGDLPLARQWQRNGTNLPGETKATLCLPHANASSYTLTLSNATGTATSAPAVVRGMEGNTP